MKKYLLTAISCLGLTIALKAQNGEFPPVTFPPNTPICDNNTWKLVFNDDFNGNALDTTLWLRYKTWAMAVEHPNWSDGRCCDEPYSIRKDENVAVSNGSAKLFLKYEPSSWTHQNLDEYNTPCPTCPWYPEERRYSSGNLQSRFKNGFTLGRFESRIKMPTFNHAHGTFWLWTGDDKAEIDIAEAYGDPFWPYGIFNIGNNRYCDYSTHWWMPRNIPNPYHIGHFEIMNRYPGNTWLDHLKGQYFKQDDYHKYAVEWDTAMVSFFLDDNRVNTIYKYYQARQYSYQVPQFNFGQPRYATYSYTLLTPATCGAVSGTYRITKGFPYSISRSCIRLTTGIDQDIYPPMTKTTVL